MTGKTIFVCETALAFGIGRMLQTFHEITNPEHQVVVVKSERELEEVIKTGLTIAFNRRKKRGDADAASLGGMLVMQVDCPLIYSLSG